MKRHQGKITVCVGSGTGIGAETASRLASEGARVIIGDINTKAVDSVVERIRAAGGEAVGMECDIADEGSVQALFAVAAEMGGLDLMHVNAADMRTLAQDKDAVETDLAVFDRTLAVGLRGHVLCTRAAIPLMLSRHGGAIVYTSSESARLAAPTSFSYGIMKSGLNYLMRHVAVRWGKENIRANAVSPGMIVTEAAKRSYSQEMLDTIANRIPSPRLGKEEDIAAMVSFLLSAEAPWVNGQLISVNGGSHC